MIRHLIGRGYFLTECFLKAAIPGSLMTDLGDVDCRDCKHALVRRGVCPNCGEKTLSWGWIVKNTSGVPDGRLRLGEVRPVFYLACDSCSETVLPSVSPDRVAAALDLAEGWPQH